MIEGALERFGEAYASHRESEGRRLTDDALAELPYVARGPLARQWGVRARTFDSFMRRVLRPERTRLRRPLSLLDLGAGNGWLSYRAAIEGDAAIALDIRADSVDGLGAAAALARRTQDRFRCVRASFQSIPLDDSAVDIAVFNASLHYATDLGTALAEAGRVVRPGGCIAILDSPFYAREIDGLRMVAEKHAHAAGRFGDAAAVLLGPPFIEFLTRERLRAASQATRLRWQRYRVAYPLWYELRPIKALLAARRPPSRFDLWVARRP